ncbi:MAG: aromatic ring-hydroxylating dioxygenase subunit alpha [Alphaproteobacteria bacterium]|nr:aromatic ring-hydroxylating dioxygenase subunit alpha [Alphaproteobacteria bacterium]
MAAPDIDRLVDTRNGLIGREIFFDKDIFQQELETVFTRAWLFVGHESLIPKPGDYFVSRMGAESVILCRDKAGKIHVLLNTCRHRGMKVCLYDEGNTTHFTCPYHHWSYATDGKLVGVPQFDTLYAGTLDREKFSLVEVAQMANYKGTIWATWDKNAPPFLEYLGGAKEHLDLALDCRDGREGGSEAFLGVHKWIIPCNWKFPAENFAGDTYHNPSHRSVDLIGIGPSAKSGVKGRRDDELKGAQHIWVNFPAGHGIHSAIQPAMLPYAEAFKDNPEIEEYFRHCYEERQRKLGEKSRLLPFVGTIFPNTSYHGRQPRSICMWHPHGPESTEVWRIFLIDKDAPAAVKDLMRHFYMRYSGPAGMTEQDDMENWNYATAGARGVIARRYPFNYQQSMGAWKENDPVPGHVSVQVTEETARCFYARWADYLAGRDWDVLMGRRAGGPQRAAAE